MNTLPNSWQGMLRQFTLDGYIRITFDAFIQLTFSRKISWEDIDFCDELRSENLPALNAGYCEWETGGENAVSLGWGWFVTSNGSMFAAPGGVSSNLIFVAQNNYVLDISTTNALLNAWLSGIYWQPERVRR